MHDDMPIRKPSLRPPATVMLRPKAFDVTGNHQPTSYLPLPPFSVPLTKVSYTYSKVLNAIIVSYLATYDLRSRLPLFRDGDRHNLMYI